MGIIQIDYINGQPKLNIFGSIKWTLIAIVVVTLTMAFFVGIEAWRASP